MFPTLAVLTLLAAAPAPTMQQLRVTLVKVTATEKKAAVTQTINGQLGALKGCYDLALKGAPGLKVTALTVKMTFEASQQAPADASTVEQSSAPDDTVSQCVKARLRTVKWPKPRAKSVVELVLQFDYAS